MIEIINHGREKDKTRFITSCPKCGCRFTYNANDVTADKDMDLVGIECPDCGEWKPIVSPLRKVQIDIDDTREKEKEEQDGKQN